MTDVNTLHGEMEKAHKQIGDVFAHISFDTPSMAIQHHVSHHDLQVKVVENVTRWSDDVVRVDFRAKYNYKNGIIEDITSSFSYGSGGWNDGFTAVEQLKVAAEAMAVAAQVVETVEQNKEFVIEAIENFMKKRDAWSEEASRIHEDKKQKQRQETAKMVAPLLRKFNPVTMEDVDAALEGVGHYGSFDGFIIEVFEENFGIYPVYYEREKYGARATYKKDHSRIAWDDIKKNVEARDIYINELGLSRWEMSRLSSKRYTSVEEFKAAVKALKED